jgi:hypothetical protein
VKETNKENSTILKQSIPRIIEQKRKNTEDSPLDASVLPLFLLCAGRRSRYIVT